MSEQTKKYLKIGLIVAGVFLFVKYFSNLWGVITLLIGAASPLLIGCAIAYILNILLKRIERFYFPASKRKIVLKTRRPVCILLSITILVCIVALVVNVVVPELIASFTIIGREIPPLIDFARDWLVKNASDWPSLQQFLTSLDIDWSAVMQKVWTVVTTGAGDLINILIGAVTGLLGIITQIVIGFIFAIYLLFHKEKLKEQFNRILQVHMKPEKNQKIQSVLQTAHETFSNFIVGQCTEAVILGVLCALGMMAFHFPYAAMTGAVIGVTALIPIAGAYIGAAIGAFMICTEDPLKALLFLLFIIILQQIEGNLIYPKVVGTSIGLPGMWVLAAVTIGGGVMGIFGMLLGVPLAATIYKLLGRSVRQKEADGNPHPEEMEQMKLNE